jgi:anti-sigma factor RsiW
VTTQTDTDRCALIRQYLMATLDGEQVPLEMVRSHLATCPTCPAYAGQLQVTFERLRGLPYPPGEVDAWPAVARAIGVASDAGQPAGQRAAAPLFALAVLIVVWRAGQLLVDAPLPTLSGLIPIVLAGAAFRLLAPDLLVVETSIPELHQERT